MNQLTGTELRFKIQTLDKNFLRLQALDVDLNSSHRFVVERFVSEFVQVEVSAELTIDSRENIQIKSGRNTERVVVGGFENGPVLFQVGAE